MTIKPRARAAPRGPAPHKRRARYGAARRLVELRELLTNAEGQTLEHIMTFFECSRHTAMRSIEALERMGELIDRRREGRTIYYGIFRAERDRSGQPSVAHVHAMFAARQ